MPTQSENLAEWNEKHPWELQGDEFHQFATERNQDYADWKTALIDAFIRPSARRDWSVLEIGCGHGRWTEHFVGRVADLTVCDISPNCISACIDRFGEEAAKYIVTSCDLASIPSESINFVWSFDVMVHMDAFDIQSYLHEMRRVMKPGAKAFLHHSDDHRHGGWRAEDMSAARMRRMSEAAGLISLYQFDSWGPNREYSVKFHQDIITVIEKRR